MTAPALRPLSLGEILDHGFGLYRTLFLQLVVIAAVCRVVPLALQVWITAAGGVLLHPWLWIVNTFFLNVLSASFAVAATTSLVSSHYLGHDVSAGSALRGAAALIWKVITVGFCTSVVVIAGFLLLVIPGFIIGAGLALSTAALILEQPLSATGAMSRSWNLTRGFRGKTFVTLLVTGLLIFVPLMFVTVVLGIALMGRATPSAVGAIIAGVFTIAVTPFAYTVVTVLYYDLRVRKEGFDIELLAGAAESA